ncbi:MAG: hypothetical protein ABIE94_04635 [archaeon]
MKLGFKETSKGLIVKYKTKSFKLEYPENLWQQFPVGTKHALFDNLAYLLTINTPLVAKKNSVEYNTDLPYFKSFFDKMVLYSIPEAVEDYKQTSLEVMRQFMNTKRIFKSTDVKVPKYNSKLGERAITAMGFGKDSLLSFGVARELGLNPIPVYINDTVSPSENKIKLSFFKKISKEFGVKPLVVINEIEKLNDFEYWDQDETYLGYTHMMTSFMMVSIPLIHKFNAKYVVVGNQQDYNFRFTNKDGFITGPSFDQTPEWMKQENIILKSFMGAQAGLISLIEPLTNIAETKILFSRYPELAKYQMTCAGLDASEEPRWCCKCTQCASSALYMQALGIDLKKVELKSKFMGKKDTKFFSLFGGKEADADCKPPEARDQQLLAFYMAYKKGVKGHLIDLFKKKYLKKAKSRYRELHKKFFKVYPSTTMPKHIKKKVESIYKQELEKW